MCLAISDNRVLLAMKKKGFGQGRWNGAGGKVQEGESVEEAAVREMREEVGLEAGLTDLAKVGDIKFYFADKPEFNQQMHIFLVKNWKGEPVESDEMRPKWFRHSEIPFGEMWIDDQYWLPKVLVGKKVEGTFYFKGGGESLDRHELNDI